MWALGVGHLIPGHVRAFPVHQTWRLELQENKQTNKTNKQQMNQARRPGVRCTGTDPSPGVETVTDTQRSRVTAQEDKDRDTDSVNGAPRAESKHTKQVGKTRPVEAEGISSVFPGKGRLCLGSHGKLK